MAAALCPRLSEGLGVYASSCRIVSILLLVCAVGSAISFFGATLFGECFRQLIFGIWGFA